MFLVLGPQTFTNYGTKQQLWKYFTLLEDEQAATNHTSIDRHVFQMFTHVALVFHQ